MRTYYDVLGLSETADLATIRSTYLRLLHIYHPDHNKDSAAGVKTAEIIEAYTTLSNPESRRAYDESLHPKPPRSSTAERAERSKSAAAPEIVCQACGIQDESLRVSTMYWVVSLLVMTRRGGKTGIWCVRCRVKQAVTWTPIAGIVGWWGIPWGPIYTIHALYFNAIGGDQDRAQNAALLRAASYQLYQKGKTDRALAAILKAIALEPDEPSSRFAQSLREMGSTAPHSLRDSLFRALTAVPSLLVIVAIVLGFSVMQSQPSGYAARYEPPTTTALPGNPSPAATNARLKVNALVDSLASQVAEHATYIGKRQKGSSTINQYELDRKKYEPSGFANLGQQIRPYLDDDKANADGFASSAYFNAVMMSLSVEIENGLAAGADVDRAIDMVFSLGEDVHISQWLHLSRTWLPYQDLTRKLSAVKRTARAFPGGRPTSGQLEALRQATLLAKAAFKQANAEGDLDGARIAAQEHDQAVDRYNELVKRNNLIITSQRGLDLAFNRCLDPKILMSKFEQVDLTSDSENENPAP